MYVDSPKLVDLQENFSLFLAAAGLVVPSRKSDRFLIGLDIHGLNFLDFSIVKSVSITKLVRRICQQFLSYSYIWRQYLRQSRQQFIHEIS